MLKKTIKKMLPDEIRYRIVEFRYNHFPGGIIAAWEKQGRPVPPPPVVKQKTVRDYQRKYQYDVLVETGTYLGYMVSAQKRNFKKIYSIELADSLYLRAAGKFRGYSHIRIIHGDSGEKIGEVIKELDEPAIFWLDGHYSGGFTAKGESNCPIWKELDTIFSKNRDHVFLIDDARDFKGTDDYPTIEELKAYFSKKDSRYKVTVENDIIRAEIG